MPINGAVEQPVGAVVQIPPQGTHTWVLDIAEIDSVTMLRQGGVYRLETDIPVVAYRHSPIGSTATNDASMLLPEHALTGHYVVASYPGTVGAYPSYFMAIAVEDGTSVDFTVAGATAGGGGVPALAAGGNAVVNMNRYGLLNVVVQAQNGGDLSGTTIDASAPIIVLGANECGNVPNASITYCDHLEEIMLPLEYWGEEYVGAHAPQRGNETYYWRVYAGEDNVTIETNPPQPGFAVTLDKGEFYQFGTKESFIFTGDGPFLPVQYLAGQNGGAGTEDPSMYQMVPVEQFLPSYAFVTGENYTKHYAQIIRPVGGAEVFVDGVQVSGYYQVGTAWVVSRSSPRRRRTASTSTTTARSTRRRVPTTSGRGGPTSACCGTSRFPRARTVPTRAKDRARSRGRSASRTRTLASTPRATSGSGGTIGRRTRVTSGWSRA